MITWQPGKTLKQMEKEIIHKAFVFYNQDSKKAASALDIPHEMFQEKRVGYAKEESDAEKVRIANETKFKEFNLRARGLVKPKESQETSREEISDKNVKKTSYKKP